MTPSAAQALLAERHPALADMPLTPVARPGRNNHMFRLGSDRLLRIPVAPRYEGQLRKEARLLDRWAAALPVPVPRVVALLDGAPPALILKWLPGETAEATGVQNDTVFARDLAHLLRAIQAMPPDARYSPGPHSFGRGGPVAAYHSETTVALEALKADHDTAALRSLWEAAVAAPWAGPDVWLHGDIAPGNLLLHRGRLSGLLDIGNCAVGDPACDLAMAWTFFQGEARAAFRATLQADTNLWARARGWVLWKAAIVAAGHADPPGDAMAAHATLRDLTAEANGA